MKFIKKLLEAKHRKNNSEIENDTNIELVSEGDKKDKETALREESEIVNVSKELKEFLNSQLLYIPDVSREIRKYDIEEIIDLINGKNEIRTNEIKIKSEIVDEFLAIIGNTVEDGFSLGELEIENKRICK